MDGKFNNHSEIVESLALNVKAFESNSNEIFKENLTALHFCHVTEPYCEV